MIDYEPTFSDNVVLNFTSVANREAFGTLRGPSAELSESGYNGTKHHRQAKG